MSGSIRVERDPAFWARIASDPAVKPHMGGEFSWDFVTDPTVVPLATDHGGFLFHRMDPLGRFYDLHAAFESSGWGKVANNALKASLSLLGPWQIVTALEVAGHWRSRPPKSFGFRPAAPFEDTYRTWFLTRDAWEASPARRRMES